jgi:hypothetical protein
MEKFLREGHKRGGTYIVTHPKKTHVSASITCPNCGEIINLDNHAIQPNGVVHPMVKCTYLGCQFKDTVLLEGWPEVYGEFLDDLNGAKP